MARKNNDYDKEWYQAQQDFLNVIYYSKVMNR
jgi:hypothetical protein